jgi:CDP-paratose 2-epimerase
LHILVTGGCGSIGSHVALHLRVKGHKVSVMDNLACRGAEMNIRNLERYDVSFFHGDVRNPEDLANLPSGIELICDTSAQPSVVTGYANPLFDITNNGLGAVHILEDARVRRFPVIFWSSNRVYGADRLNALPRRETDTRYDYDADAWHRLSADQRPAGFHPAHGVSETFSIDGGQRSIYGLSKLIADAACQEYAHAFDLPIVVNRFGVISGVGQFGKADQGWVVWWAIAHWFGLPLTYLGWQGKQVRDVLFVEDMLALLELQIGQISRFCGEVFNVGGGQANSISLADIVLYYTDNRKTTQLLGWKPKIGLQTGFRQIFD